MKTVPIEVALTLVLFLISSICCHFPPYIQIPQPLPMFGVHEVVDNLPIQVIEF